MATASRILINGRFVSPHHQGLSALLLKSCRRLIDVSDGKVQLPPIEIILPQGVEPKVRFVNMPFRAVGRRQGHLWEQPDLPGACSGVLLVNPAIQAPSCRGQQAVVVHDAAVLLFRRPTA